MRIKLNLIHKLKTERDTLIDKIEWHNNRDFHTSGAYLQGRLDLINEILGDR